MRTTDPKAIEKTIGLLGIIPDHISKELTINDARELFNRFIDLKEKENLNNQAIRTTEFRGWTFLEHFDSFGDPDVSSLAKKIGADVCFSCAVSTTWVLWFSYALANGDLRSRSFMIPDLDIEKKILDPNDKSEPLVVRQVKDVRGRTFGFDMIPKVLIGPNDELVPPESVGMEEQSGHALIGEPLNVVMADDERLLAILSAIGLPIGAIFRQWYCSVPDVFLKNLERDEVIRLSLEMLKRDKLTEETLSWNPSPEEKICTVYASGPDVRNGHLLKPAKGSLFSRLKWK